MVSTEKRYTSDNFPALRGAILRGEYFYQIRLYYERAGFQSAETGSLRMQMLLGFIEARAVVIDAIIRTEETLCYLSVLCASMAAPEFFSPIMRRTVPQAIIEEIEKKHAEDWIASRSLRSEAWNVIPFAGAVRTVNESRRILLSLLLEYRALLAEYDAVMPSTDAGMRRRHIGSVFAVNFLLFEQDGSVCGVPDFQTVSVSNGANGSCLIQLHREYGQQIVICDDLLCMKEIGISDLEFGRKKKRGYYSVRVPALDGTFEFTLIVSSFL